uniref:ZP domain-containing protein n=1 Tax=Steinernema glaseri TaxID=37863 RepID=A0A1I7ZHD8_9BILA
MRSTVRLLAALLLLTLCPTSSSAASSSSYENVVACGSYNDAYGVRSARFAWSPKESQFVRGPDAADCGFESVSLMCIDNFKTLSYGVDINETRTFNVTIPEPPKDETVETKLFQCQGRSF